MKRKGMKKTILLVGMFSLAGCASITSNAPVTKNEAERYSDLGAFFQERFTNFHSLSGWKSERLSDGGIRFKAFFTPENTSSVRKPREDIESYCVAKGGQYSVITQTSIDVLRGRMVGDPGATYNYALSKGASEDVARGAAANTYARMREFYRNSNSAWDQRAINSLTEKGYFGASTCRVDGAEWVVTIVPTDYKSADPRNQLTASQLILELRAERKM